MKKVILILICIVWISTYGVAQESEKTAIALLPDGISIELVGLRNFSVRDLREFNDGRDYPWWQPAGTALSESPDVGRMRTSVSDAYWFVVRVNGIEDCQLKVVGQLDSDLTVQPVQNKGQGFENDDLRSFTLIFFNEQQQADIKLGFTTNEWEVVENWPFWENAAPDDSFFSSSEGVIMRCPEQQGPDVVAEITQTNLDDATRLVVFDKKGQLHESTKSAAGSGSGLIRYTHRFRELNINNIEHLEFQKKTYSSWITYSNVSLNPEHKTTVEVEIEYVNSLINKKFLELDNLQINFSSVEFENKKVLACFFDYEQRPSRNCITQLNTRAKELKAQGIEIVAIQASKIDENALNQWLEENNITFPVGMIEANEEETRFKWGVQSLPWLILTDRKHIVRAEGFSVNELNSKIEESEQ